MLYNPNFKQAARVIKKTISCNQAWPWPSITAQLNIYFVEPSQSSFRKLDIPFTMVKHVLLNPTEDFTCPLTRASMLGLRQFFREERRILSWTWSIAFMIDLWYSPALVNETTATIAVNLFFTFRQIRHNASLNCFPTVYWLDVDVVFSIRITAMVKSAA